MRPLSDCLEELEPRLRGAARIWVGSDFDGTLCPLAATPQQASLDHETRSVLRRLALCPGVSVAVISGRALADVREKVGIETIAYAGNHGLEIEGPGLRHVVGEADAFMPVMGQAVLRLRERLEGIPGVLIEDKGLSASVHVRGVPDAMRESVRRLVREVIDADSDLITRRGSMVWEVRPAVSWGKGRAASWLLQRQAGPEAAALYLGDDETDEDAFRALRSHTTILVGPARATEARYGVESHVQAAAFLDWLLRIREDAARSRAPRRAAPSPAVAEGPA